MFWSKTFCLFYQWHTIGNKIGNSKCQFTFAINYFNIIHIGHGNSIVLTGRLCRTMANICETGKPSPGTVPCRQRKAQPEGEGITSYLKSKAGMRGVIRFRFLNISLARSCAFTGSEKPLKEQDDEYLYFHFACSFNWNSYFFPKLYSDRTIK